MIKISNFKRIKTLKVNIKISPKENFNDGKLCPTKHFSLKVQRIIYIYRFHLIEYYLIE